MRIILLALVALCFDATLAVAGTRLPNPNDDPALGDAVPGQQFGGDLAIDGATLAVGSFDGSDAAGSRVGTVHLFVREGGVWVKQAKLVAPSGRPYDGFGAAVALEGDTLVVGAPNTSRGDHPYLGAAYVYTRSNGTWSHAQTLDLPEPASDGFFGQAVALDGDWLAVAAPQVDLPGAEDAGAVTLFERTAGGWVARDTVVASAPSRHALFGSALEFAGGELVVGASGEALQRGGVYAFARDDQGWVERQHLVGGNAVASDFFGMSLASDGTRLLVGAPAWFTTRAGRVIEYRRVADAWVEAGVIERPATANLRHFGLRLAHAAGRWVIGAERRDAGESLTAIDAYTYAVAGDGIVETAARSLPYAPSAGWGLRALATDGAETFIGLPFSVAPTWSDAGEVRVLAANGDVLPPIHLGRTAAWETYGHALAANDRWLFVGAPAERARSKVSGAVYAYDFGRSSASTIASTMSATASIFDPTNPEPLAIVALDGVRDDRAGSALAMSGDTLLVAAPRRANGGAVDLYELVGAQWLPTTRWASPAGADSASFGQSLAADATAAIVASPFELTSPDVNGGAAYVYARAAGGWAAPTRLSAGAPVEREVFGASVAIDGNIAVVGSLLHDSGMFGEPIVLDGAAYVFERDGGAWIERARLARVPDDGTGWFGMAVAVAGDTVFVSAPGRDEVHVHRRSANAWAWVQRIVAPPGTAGTFGERLRVVDGELWVGASDRGALAIGSVHRYRAVDGSWSAVQSITASSESDRGAGFGADLAVLEDRVYVGVPYARGRVPFVTAVGAVGVEEVNLFGGGFED